VDNDSTNERVIIQVDYYHLPIRCRLCHATNYVVKDCPRSKRTGGSKVPTRREPNKGSSYSASTIGERNEANLDALIGNHNPTILLDSEGSADRSTRRNDNSSPKGESPAAKEASLSLGEEGSKWTEVIRGRKNSRFNAHPPNPVQVPPPNALRSHQSILRTEAVRVQLS